MRVGVLALQGGFAAHLRALADLGHEAVAVRRPAELERVAGLVLPGGESTAQLRLIEAAGLAEPLNRFVATGAPVLCTCAGVVLAAREVDQPAQPSFGWLDAAVARNAWGRQVHSFEAMDDSGRLPLVFIRAPRIRRVGSAVPVRATLRGEPVWVQQGALHATTFHPELTGDRTVHATAFGPERRPP